MPTKVELDCLCWRFRALYGDQARWFPHWAHDCEAVAPWIRTWALRRLDGGGPPVVESPSPQKEAP